MASHLNDLLKRVQMKTFNPDTDSAEVICVLFEVRLLAHLKCLFYFFWKQRTSHAAWVAV